MYKYYTLKYVHVLQSAVPIFLVGIQNSNAQCMHPSLPYWISDVPATFLVGILNLKCAMHAPVSSVMDF